MVSRFSAKLISSLFCCLFALSKPLFAQEITLVSAANTLEATSFYVDGPFEDGAAERLLRLIEDQDNNGVFNITLNSPGGSLLEGLKIGEIIREHKLWTSIGKWQISINGFPDQETNEGICASACAYAFLGGVERFAKGNQLGFHQFYRSNNYQLDDISSLTESEISGNAQVISAIIANYLVGLGDIDPRVLLVASITKSSDVYWLSAEELEEFEIVTSSKEDFSSFWIEPYKSGAVAASRRNRSISGYEGAHAYDRVGQATIFCRSSKNILMLSVDQLAADRQTYTGKPSWDFWNDEGVQTTIVEEKLEDIRVAKSGRGWIELHLNERIVSSIYGSKEWRVSIDLGRPNGGLHYFIHASNDLDKQSIKLVLRNCI